MALKPRVPLWGVLVLALMVTGLARAEQSQEKLSSAEYEGRKVIMPPDLPLDLDWYSPVVDLKTSGKIARGWVSKDMILLETDLNFLIGVRRSDGTERWRMKMRGPLMFEPVVTSHNVFVVVKNYLSAIEKRSGQTRWRILPKFPISCAPYVSEPALYPRRYTKEFIPLEHVYTGTWNNYFQGFQVRARLYDYVREKNNKPIISAPQYDIFYLWQKNMRLERAICTQHPLMMDGTIYFATDDKRIRAVSPQGEDRESYLMQGEPTTKMALSSNTLYVGARDCYLYALDRLTMRKKWIYAPGVVPTGSIYSDEAEGKPVYVFVTTSDAVLHGIKVISAKQATKTTLEEPESYKLMYKIENTGGVITAGERKVYIGSGNTKGFDGYRKVRAVLKDSGKTEWASESKGVRFYIQFHNAWYKSDEGMRLFAVTEDNRLLSLKERADAVGPVVEKVAKAEEKKAAPKKP